MAEDVTIPQPIEQLRVQLAEAQARLARAQGASGGKTLRFLTKSVEVELAVVFKTEVDKKIFDVNQSLASKGGTAQDALRQVPTLSVDATGKVVLRSGAPIGLAFCP